MISTLVPGVHPARVICEGAKLLPSPLVAAYSLFMRRNFRVRTSPGASVFGALWAGVFVVIGFTVAIPTFGNFGILWTLVAVGICGAHLYNALSKRGLANQVIEVDDRDDASSALLPPMGTTRSLETRLRTLNGLRDQGLISAEEHARRREEILKSI